MHTAFITIWNDTVKDGDTVYLLGDLALNPKWVKQIFPLLKGYKILIPGNHDQCFEWKNRPESVANFKKKYLSWGINEIHQMLEITLKNDQKVLLSHLPYNTQEGNTYDQRYQEYRPKDKGLPLLHGHLHCCYRKYGKMIDVGFDGDLKLWSEDEIIELMNDPREFIPSPITGVREARQKERGHLK